GPSRLAMNCSGKHAGMLLTCLAAGWPLDGYWRPEHPLQRQLTATVEEFTGERAAAVGVDGCGAPVLAVSLTGLARAFLRLVTAEPGCPERTVADAMRAYPELVGGTGADDTRLMRGVPGMLAKIGAEGVIAAALPGVGAVALKIDDGATRARMPVLVSGLRRLGVQAPVLTEYAELPLLGGGLPVGEYGTNLTDDLKRRDFTVNAMAVSLPDHRFTDPYGGLDDLAAKIIRTPGTPAESFGDDPLRMLRAARFAAQLCFAVHPDVRAAMVAMAADLDRITAERVRDEFTKLLCGADPITGLRLLVDTGLADRFLPELTGLKLTIDEHAQHKDVYEHTLTVVSNAVSYETDGCDFVLRMAALMHDVGKPATKAVGPDGRVSFHHHEVVGARLTKNRMKALRY
ncbi:asparaginase, partial [Streptomyces sp. NPDC052644]